jgi:hypothetical protein
MTAIGPEVACYPEDRCVPIPLKNSVVFRRIVPVIDGCEALSVASSAGLRLIALKMGF